MYNHEGKREKKANPSLKVEYHAQTRANVHEKEKPDSHSAPFP